MSIFCAHDIPMDFPIKPPYPPTGRGPSSVRGLLGAVRLLRRIGHQLDELFRFAAWDAQLEVLHILQAQPGDGPMVWHGMAQPGPMDGVIFKTGYKQWPNGNQWEPMATCAPASFTAIRVNKCVILCHSFV